MAPTLAPIAARLAKAVHGAVWAHYDEPHARLYVGRFIDGTGYVVCTVDVVTGALADEAWPLNDVLVHLLGTDRAFRTAVEERIKQGY